jgi:hypothetical protein
VKTPVDGPTSRRQLWDHPAQTNGESVIRHARGVADPLASSAEPVETVTQVRRRV